MYLNKTLSWFDIFPADFHVVILYCNFMFNTVLVKVLLILVLYKGGEKVIEILLKL